MANFLEYYKLNIEARIESLNFNVSNNPLQDGYMPCTRNYDILIPVYNAYEFTSQCIEHVITHTDHRHTLYLLDDASTDPRMKPLLQGFADRFDHVTFLESSRNLGFVQNTNRGFALSRNDVVILNSDTQVTRGWLERMDRCLAQHPKTAVISPLSNNATFLSVPLMNTKNELPVGHTPDSVSDLVALHTSRIYPLLPVAVGFCMLMTRASLDMLGGFDTIFGNGYGEECDYCMRVWAAGMEVRCCDDAYVHHFGEASFAGVNGIRAERIQNRELIDSRWPDYKRNILSYCLRNPLLQLQEKIYHALHTNPKEKRPHVLHVIHSLFNKTCPELHTLNIASRISKDFRSTIFSPHMVKNWLDVEAGQINEFIRVALLNDQIIENKEHFCGYPNDLFNDPVEHKFTQFLRGGDYSVVHFQHQIKWDSLLLPFIAKALGKKVVISLHDYFLLCPEYNLILPSHTKCDKAYALEYDESCFTCLGEKRFVTDPSNAVNLHEYLAERHTLVGLMLKEADVIVAPSDFVKKQFIRAFDGFLEEKIRVIPHGISVSAQICRPKRSDNLRVAFLGNLTYQKGAQCLLEAAERLKDKKVTFNVFGGIADETLAEKVRQSNIALHGSYQVEDLPALLAQIDIVLIPSVWHETFCLTLSEAQALGVPVIAADLGALSERIVDGETGFLFRVADAEHLVERLCEIAQNPDSLNPVINALSKQRVKTIQENVEDYAKLYNELTQTSNKDSLLYDSEETNQKPCSSADTIRSESNEETVLRNSLVGEACSKARILSQNGDVDGAVHTLLNQGIKAYPASPLPYLEISEILIRAGRFEDALQVLPEMPVAVDPALKQELAAICHCGLGDDQTARQAAQQAGGRPRALVVLGTLAARQGDLAEAECLFRQAIQNDPACGSGWLALGMLLWGQGLHEEAFEALKRAVIVDPLNREAVQILRDMAERLERQLATVEILISASQTYPDCRHLALHKALLLARVGQATAASVACEEFLVRFGADDQLLEAAGALRERAGLYDRLAEAGQQSISLCMIVKDEEACLARCLASVKPAVHELVVADTGSADRTVAIAKAFGVRVSQFPWNGSFSDARNYALEQARGNLILVLDADEVIATQDHAAIAAAASTAAQKKCAFSVLTRNYTTMIHAQGWTANDGSYPAEERAEGWQPSTKVRMFPNDRKFRFRGDVHEMVEPSLREAGIKLQPAPFVVHHYGELEQDPVKQLDKKLGYFEAGMQKLAQQPDDLAAISELAVQAGELGRLAEAIGLWNRVLEQYPDCVEALFNKGYCLMGLQRYTEALECSRRALALEPAHKEAAFNYGTCELYVGDPQRALTLVKPVAAQHPDYPLLKSLLAILYLATDSIAAGQKLVQELLYDGYGINGYIQERVAVLTALHRSDLADRIMRNRPGG